MFIKDEVVFINLQNLKDEFYCGVCNFPLTSQQDFEKRNKIIDNLTLEKVNRVAREIFQSENLFFLVVGNDFD